MVYIKEDKSKGIKEEYIPEWINDIDIQPFVSDNIP